MGRFIAIAAGCVTLTVTGCTDPPDHRAGAGSDCADVERDVTLDDHRDDLDRFCPGRVHLLVDDGRLRTLRALP